MAIIDVVSLGTSYDVDDDGHRNYTSTFRAISDQTIENPIDIASDVRLPQWRTPYVWPYPGGATKDLWSFVRGWTIVPESDMKRGWWLCTYNYSTRPVRQEAVFADPLTEPDRYAGSYMMATKGYKKDIFELPLTNSAEQSLGELEGDDPRDEFVIITNTASIDRVDVLVA